jgi:uncharacterized PurR-regulated membrane protein YhhQ (DUF165 family)
MFDKDGIPRLAPLPWEQYEHPGKRRLSDVKLHGRREGVFTLLVGTLLISALMLPLLGWERTVDWEIYLPGPEWRVPALPLGLLTLPLVFFAAQLIAEFFGWRRAAYAVFLTLAAQSAAVGMRATVEGWEVWNEGAGLLAGYGAAFLGCTLLYVGLSKLTLGSHLWIRLIAGQWLGVLLGGAAMAAVWMPLWGLEVPGIPYSTLGVVAGIGLCSLLLVIPAYLSSRAATVFLRLTPRGARPEIPASAFAPVEPRFARPEPPRAPFGA